MKRMKSSTLKILILVMTLSGCMPDSLTKFKEDAPKKKSSSTSGGTSSSGGSSSGGATVIPPDFFLGNGITCANGANTSTVTTNPVAAAAIALPFTSSATYLATPYSLDAVNDPNYAFVLSGDGVTAITDLSGATGINCVTANDEATTVFNDATLGAKLTWSIAPALPAGLTQDTTTGKITGTLTGFNELAAYTVTATNGTTAVAETDQIKIASSTPLTAGDAYYPQTNGTLWGFEVEDSDIDKFIPNYWVINEKGAFAVINFVDSISNLVYVQILTPASEDHYKYFSDGDKLEIIRPVGTVAVPGSPVYASQDSSIIVVFATLLTNTDISGGADQMALHFKESSGLVQTGVAYDGITTSTDELNEWTRCTHSPDISDVGTVNFLDGITGANLLTDISTVTNWGTSMATLAGDDDYTVILNRPCEFSGQFTSIQPYTSLTSTLYNYAGDSITAKLKLVAKDTIAQPFPITNPYSAGGDSTEKNDREFYFHYRYTGSASDAAKMILTVADSSRFSYNDIDPSKNKISNQRGTVGDITFISGNKLFITLSNSTNPNGAFAFVPGDSVDNSATFLAAETTIDLVSGTTPKPVEYTFDVNKSSNANTVFTPSLALLRSKDRINIDAAGDTITPFTGNQFSTDFIKQVRVDGEVHILNDNHVIEVGVIQSIDLTPGNHSIELTPASAFGAGGGIRSDVNRISYLSPLDSVLSESGTISYSIDSYVGISGTDLVLLYDGATPLITFSTTTGNIAIVSALTKELESQTFTVTATDSEGRVASTQINLSISATPTGLSMNRNLLLNVPSGSAFKIGSYISSNNADPGLGIVKDIINDDASTYDMIDIQLIKGTFNDDDDLDNRQKFDSQKTYIFNKGVIPYNVSVIDTGTGTLDATLYQDRYSCSTPVNRRFINGGAASWDAATFRGVVAYAWSDATATDDSTLHPGIKNKLYLQVEKGTSSITNTSTFDYITCTGSLGGATHTINEIVADNMILGIGAASTLDTGLNITSDNAGAGAGSPVAAGVIHLEDDPGNQVYIGQYYFAANSIFLYGAGTNTVDNVNPYVASEATISSITFDHTFYLYRNEEASIKFNLETGSDTEFQLLEFNNPTVEATLPDGLVFDTTERKISGTPIVNADKEKFILRASSPYGVIDHPFELKVYDQFVVAPRDDATVSKPDSYLMHQVGYGMASVPCRITQEAIDTGNADVVDLTCILDGGESDIYYKGINLVIRTGDDMCSVVNHTPYYYYDRPYVQTSNTRLYQNTGDYDDPLCGSQPEYTEVATAANTSSTYNVGNAPATQALSAQVTPPAEQCFSTNGGSDYSQLTPSGPNCDDGEVSVSTQVWQKIDFVCLNSFGEQTADDTIAACQENNGTCDNASPGTCAASCSADCSECQTQTECTFGGGNAWTVTSTHNDTSAGGTDTPAQGCNVATPVVADLSCGGEPGACISGAGTDMSPTSLAPEQLGDKTQVVHNMTGANKVEISYGTPDQNTGRNTNFFLVNHMNRLTCDAQVDEYSFDWSDGTSDNNADWIDYSQTSPNGAAHPFAGGYNYYSYSCDSGAGTVARVRMIVRDWDNPFTVTDGIEKIRLATAHPYDAAPGADTLLNDIGNSFCTFGPCNGIKSWDDYFDEPESTTTCGNATLRFDFGELGGSGGANSLFPQEK